MKIWTFKGFIDDRQQNVFDVWYRDELTIAAQAKVDWLLEDLFPTRAFVDWGAKHIKKYTDNIYEVRFEINKICYRPLGGFLPFQNDFTFLVGVIKKTKIPKSTIEIAETRFDIIKNDPSRARECELE